MIPITNLKQIPLFTYLPDDAVVSIQNMCQERSYERGQTIFSEDEPAKNVYVLEKGTVAIRMMQYPREENVMVSALRDKGVLFGWSAVIGHHSYTASAVCMDDVTVIEIDGHRLRDLIHEDPETGVVILDALANVIAARLQSARMQLIGAPVAR
jgi:CRP-like cAMP-binding protein